MDATHESPEDQKTKKPKTSKNKKSLKPPKVWINPNSTFKGPRGNRAWDHGLLSPPTAARLLELADIALGAVEPSHPPAKKKTAA